MGKTKILILEDESIFAESLRLHLTNLGYEIVGPVSNGEEAVKIIQKDKPNLAIIDIKLKGKLDGIDTVNLIKKEIDIPIIYLTAYSDDTTIDRVQSTEPAGFLTKPIDYNDLNATIRISLYKHSMDIKLRESESRYKVLYENNPLMIFTLNSSYKIINANQHAHEDLGYGQNQLLSKPFTSIFPTDAYREVEDNLKKCMDNVPKTFSWESKIQHSDGRTIWIKQVACALINGTKHILVTCENITEQKIAEEKILETNKLLKMVTDEASDLIAIVNLDGKRLYNSKSYSKILGDSRELEGTDSFNEIHPDDRERIKQLFIDTIATGIGKLTQYRFLLKDNSIRHIESQGNLIRNSDGEPEKVLIVARDITERKQSEKKLAEYNEELKTINATKDKLFSIIAHDLRSPFTSLLGFSEYMAKYYEELSIEELKEYSTMLYHSAQSIFNLLENLLQWSRMQTEKYVYEPAEFNLAGTLQRVHNLFSLNAKDKNIDFVIEAPKEIKVLAEENTVFTIIRNLVSNAIKFTPIGGKVTLLSKLNEKLIYISVNDSGVGISRENIQKLFKENIHYTVEGTEKEKGTGLGLLLCKELVDRYNGNIFVESEIGKGSTFSFTIPIA